jgi:hypothetical protein
MASPLYAQEDSTQVDRKLTTIDSAHVERKDFSEEHVQKLKRDSDLNYKTPPTVAENFWSRLLAFFFRLFEHLFRGATATGAGKLIVYLLILGIAVAVILVLLKVNAFRIFFSGADEGSKNYAVFHENIHEMDFEKLIRDAVRDQKSREGTRLVFLHALKILSDKQLISWDPGKTNHDYVEELKEGQLKAGLNELSFYFDYAWYGDFPVSAETFEKVQTRFATWREHDVMKAK